MTMWIHFYLAQPSGGQGIEARVGMWMGLLRKVEPKPAISHSAGASNSVTGHAMDKVIGDVVPGLQGLPPQHPSPHPCLTTLGRAETGPIPISTTPYAGITAAIRHFTFQAGQRIRRTSSDE